jgi:hypothetical protein
VPYPTRIVQKLSAIVGWIALAFVVFATLSPIEARPSIGGAHLEHFVAFALTGGAFALAYPKRFFLVVLAVVGTALGLEALQLLTPDRHARAIDALIKALGGLSGIGASQLVHFLIRSNLPERTI